MIFKREGLRDPQPWFGLWWKWVVDCSSDYLNFIIFFFYLMEENRNEFETTTSFFCSTFPLISSSFSSFASPDLYPPVCTHICSGLIATVASQNRAPPVRGERCCLGIDWARHALWWLMLKRFLTKRICKRCVTHGAFLHSSIPGGGPPRTGTVQPLSFHSWLIDRMLEEG